MSPYHIFRTLRIVAGFFVVGCLVAPLLYAVWLSFSPDSFLTPPERDWSVRWYQAFATDSRWSMALSRSLMVGLACAVLSVLAGAMLAYGMERYLFRGKGTLGILVLLPMCIPPAVLGMGLLPLFYAVGLWGSLLGLVLGHAMMCLPIVFLIVRSKLRQMNPDHEMAARGLGATPSQVVGRIIIPLWGSALVVGAAAAFAVSFNESMVTLFLATPTTETLPAMIWPQLRYSPSPLVAVASVISVIIALGVASGLGGIVKLVGAKSRNKPG